MASWVPELTRRDIKFISETLLIPESDLKDYRDLDEIIGNELLFKRVMNEEEVFVRISPFLFFKILIKRAQRELRWEGYTVEKDGIYSVYVFDTDILSRILDIRDVRDYLATLLASFSKVKSFVIYLFIRKRFYKFRQSSLDVEALEEELNLVEEEKRFPLLRRIADTILFLSGLFPEYVRKKSEHLARIKRKSVNEIVKEFEDKGSMYYQLASMHEEAKRLGMQDVLYTFSQNFSLLKKPLNFIERRYLGLRKERIF